MTNETPEQQEFMDEWRRKPTKTYELTDETVEHVVRHLDTAMRTNQETIKHMMTAKDVEMATLESIIEKGLKLKMIYEEFVNG